MAQTDRLYRLKHLFDTGRCFSSAALLAQLEVSHATLKRDIALLQDRMNCPIFFDRQEGGYRLDASRQLIGAQYELPGHWFTADEIYAVLTMQHLVANLDASGLLGQHIDPLMKRLISLLDVGDHKGADLTRRIRVQTLGARPVCLPNFQAVGAALLSRQRIVINYHARTANEGSDRTLSPQRMTHYRSNWYLDAWCHWRNALRRFSVDLITHVRVQDDMAIDVPEAELDAALGSGYGIFSGAQVQWATLRFAADRARWVAAETWHPKQEGHFEPDGSYLLRLPYTDPRELVMDVLRHVPEVDVLGPPELRQMVVEKVRAAIEKMSPSSSGELWGGQDHAK